MPREKNLGDFHVIVLAAGLGSRLRPLTHLLPKPVVPVGGRSLCLHTIQQLVDAGANTIHINTSYLAESTERMIRHDVQKIYGDQSPHLEFWPEPHRLETGGAICRMTQSLVKRDQALRTRDLFVVSGDILGQIPVYAMIKQWESRTDQDFALMVTRPLEEERPDKTWTSADQLWVQGFGKDCTPESSGQMQASLFMNYQVISTNFVEGLECSPISSIDLIYRHGLRQNLRIQNLVNTTEAFWFDAGRPADYARAQRALSPQVLPQHSAVALDSQIPLFGFRPKKRERVVTDRSPCFSGFLSLGHLLQHNLLFQTLSAAQFPEHYALTEGDSQPLLQALTDFTSGFDWREDFNKEPETEDLDVTRLLMVLEIQLKSDDQLPLPFLVEAGHFFAVALSQRGAPEGSSGQPDQQEPWLALLFTRQGSQSNTLQ